MAMCDLFISHSQDHAHLSAGLQLHVTAHTLRAGLQLCATPHVLRAGLQMHIAGPLYSQHTQPPLCNSQYLHHHFVTASAHTNTHWTLCDSYTCVFPLCGSYMCVFPLCDSYTCVFPLCGSYTCVFPLCGSYTCVFP